MPAPPQQVRQLPRPVRDFLAAESSGGLVLLVAAGAALVWANSPWRESYEQLWSIRANLRLGDWRLDADLRHWVNDGLMALFFLVVGLEVKQELVTGSLRTVRTASLPVAAALGGMLVPAAIYASLNPTGPAARGWGIPMATDIAFAVGVLTLLGRRSSASLKLFLLTLAVVDDVGAILVIAVFYSGGIQWGALLVGGALLAVALALRVARVWWPPVFIALGVGLWLSFFHSGIHATLAGVVMGLLAPARPLAPRGIVDHWTRDLAEDLGPSGFRALTRLAATSVSFAQRLQHDLHPWTSLAIVPLFALANAGVRLEFEPTAVGSAVALGLVVGKPAGIALFSWLAVRLRIADLPDGLGWIHVVGAGAVAGIGFTVSLFVTGLAFESDALQAAAKLGILVGSVAAAALGWVVLSRATPPDER